MADLNAIAHGVDSETGEYLSPEDRKAIFKNKGKMGSKIKPESFRSGIVTATRGSDNKGGGGLVKFSGSSITKVDEKVEEKETAKEDKTFETDEVHNLFEEIRSTFYEVHQVKTDKKRLQSKFLEVLSKSNQTSEPKKETTPEKKSGMGIGKKILGAATGLFSNVLGIIGDLLKFAVLDFISKPENKKTVEAFTKILTGVFKFLDWFITGTLDNLLTGFAELVGGDSILERIGGFFKLVLGVVGLRWLLNPLKILKDLKNIFKFGKKFTKIFRGIFKLGDKGLKNSFGGILKLAGKAFRKTLGRMLQRVLLKVFGKAITKGLVAVTKSVVKGITKVVGKVPIVGPLIAFGVNLMMGEPLGRAAFKTLGSIFLSGVGTALGGPVGWAIGGLIGDWAGGALYDAFFGGKEGDKKEEKKEDTPELASGGVVSGPEEGYLAILHGTEAVIPIAKIPEILTLPFKLLGSNIVGAIFAVINSLGPVGGFVKPIAISVLAPAMKLFGVETFTKSSNVGDTKGDAETLSRHVESEQEKQDLDKLFGKDLLKDIGTMLMISGGSLVNSILGGPAQAKQSDPSSKRPGAGANLDGGGGADLKPTPGNTSGAAGQWKPLLELIAAYESVGGSYDSIYPSTTKPGLSQMTIAEADAWQGSTAKSRGSAAAGRYQFMYIKDQAAAAGIGPNELFSPENQDKMAINLLTKKRGISLDMIKNNPDEAMIRLGMEWASMPMPKSMKGHRRMVNAGQSYYAGDGLNAAHVGVDDVKSVLSKVAGSSPQKTPQQSAAAPSATPGQNLTPEQKSSMFQKSGMSAMASNALSSAKPSTPDASSTTPSTPAAKMTSSPPRSSSMVPMSNNFSITRNISNNKQNVSMAIVKMNNTRKSNLTNMQAPLNNTSISESIISNRI